MGEDNLLTSIMAILGSDPLLQVNRLQMYESKFHELSNLYKILEKKTALTERILHKFWPDLRFRSQHQIMILEDYIQAIIDEKEKLFIGNSELQKQLQVSQNQISEIDKKLLVSENEIKTLQNEILLEKAKYSDLQAQTELNKVNNQELELKHLVAESDKRKELQSLKQKFKDLKQTSAVEISDVKNQATDLEKQNASYKLQLEELTKELSAQKDLNASLDQKFIEYDKTRFAVLAGVELNSKQMLSVVKEENNSLKRQLEKYQSELDSLINAKSKVEMTLKEMELENTQKIDSLTKEKELSESLNQNLESQIKSITSEWKEQESHYKIKEEELIQTIDSIREENLVLSRTITDLENSLNQVNEEYTVGTNEHKEKHYELHERYKLLRMQSDIKHATIIELESNLSEFKQKTETEETKYTALELEYKQLKEDFIEMEKSNL